MAAQTTLGDSRRSELPRRDDRVAEGARLESVCTGNRTVGSNPTLSAKTKASGPPHRAAPDPNLRGPSPVHCGSVNPARPGREQR